MQAWSFDKKLKFQKFLTEHAIQRVDELNIQMSKLNTALTADSKSSAGDKYETTREMIGHQINQIALQLNVMSAALNLLPKINFGAKDSLEPGTVFKAGGKLFSWSFSFGKVIFEEESVLCISSQSPFAQTCLDAKVGEDIGMPQNRITLEWIV